MGGVGLLPVTMKVQCRRANYGYIPYLPHVKTKMAISEQLEFSMGVTRQFLDGDSLRSNDKLIEGKKSGDLLGI